MATEREPKVYKKILREKAVYWPPDGFEPGTNKPKYKAPVEIRSRWEPATEEYINAQGKTLISRTRVFVDRTLEFGGVLWKGSFEKLRSVIRPYDNPEAYRIEQVNEIANARRTKVLKWVML